MNDLMNIENKILVIRGQQVLLDRDLAELYGVETRRINEQVKRNIERFPDQFCFSLVEKEKKELVANCDRFRILKHSSFNPYAFTEQGVAMLSAVLRSETAIKVSIDIMNAFVAMRHFLMNNAGIINRISDAETKLIEHDEKIETLFTLMDKYKIEDKQVDRLTIKNLGVDVIIYTLPKAPIKKLDIAKFNAQYPSLTLKHTNNMHDRFLIIDRTEIYHIGASLKDLGKKCFGFTKLEDAQLMIKTVLNAV